MKLIYKLIFALLSITLLLGGCEKNPSAPEYQKEVTIFGYLWGNENLTENHAIMIAYTRPVTKYYDPAEAAIKGATVTLTESASGVVTQLVESTAKPGYYYNGALLIKQKSTYTLTVKTGSETVTAVTTVPAVLEIESDLKTDSPNVENDTNLGYRKPVFVQHEDPDQLIMVEMYCNEAWNNAEYIYPFGKDKYPQSQDEYDSGGNGEPRRIFALVKMSDLTAPDYENKNTIYWYASMIVFYGSNTLSVLAIDDNMHHYMTKEHPEISGGVQGGIGLFGSLCGTKYNLQIVK